MTTTYLDFYRWAPVFVHYIEVVSFFIANIDTKTAQRQVHMLRDIHLKIQNTDDNTL